MLTLGLEVPWILMEHYGLPHHLNLDVDEGRFGLYSCLAYNRGCEAHDFADKNWRNLNFFQFPGSSFICLQLPERCQLHHHDLSNVIVSRVGCLFDKTKST